MLRSLTFISIQLATVSLTLAQISPTELVAPIIEKSGTDLMITARSATNGLVYQLQESNSLKDGSWNNLEAPRSGYGPDLTITTAYIAGYPNRFYRIFITQVAPAPEGFSLIPAGSFEMGSRTVPIVPYRDERTVHTVHVSDFYMARNEVTQGLWSEVKNWGSTRGYTDLPEGYFFRGTSNTPDRPALYVSWYQAVKWCNAYSEKLGLNPCYKTNSGGSQQVYRAGSGGVVTCDWSANGIRLPTEAEWEKAARGGNTGKNYPWGNTISHTDANYYSSSFYDYDRSPTRGRHPDWSLDIGTSPVASFEPNGYGLYDMSGNVWEWVWDVYSSSYYSSSPTTDPRGPVSGSFRVYRGGSWNHDALDCRVSRRNYQDPSIADSYFRGFRIARNTAP